MFRYDMVSDVVKKIDAICQHNSDVSLEDQNCPIFYRDFTCIALSIYILKRPFWGETRLWPAVSLPLILSTYVVSCPTRFIIFHHPDTKEILHCNVLLSTPPCHFFRTLWICFFKWHHPIYAIPNFE